MSARDVPLPLPAPAAPERLPLLLDRARFRLGEARDAAATVDARPATAGPAARAKVVAAAEAALEDCARILERADPERPRPPATALPIDAVRVGERHRRDLGDLEALAASIDEVGLLQPIAVTAAGELVFGHRRLLACRDHLGWTEIPARVVDVPSIVAGEYHENELRKAFTASERVAILEAIERKPPHRPGKNAQNLATSDEAAKRAGFGNRETARQARDVVAAMDRGEVSIDAAHRAIKAEPDPAKQAAWTPEDIKRAARERLAAAVHGKTADQVAREPETLGALMNAATAIGQLDGEPPATVAGRLLAEAFPDIAAARASTAAAQVDTGAGVTPRDPGLDARAAFLARVSAVLHRRDPWPFAAMAAATPEHVVVMDIEDLQRVAALVDGYLAALKVRSAATA